MQNHKKALITDYVHPVMMQRLRSMGYHVTYAPEIIMDEVFRFIPEYQILVVNTKVKADKKLMDQAKHLKYIARLGSGLDRIDVKYAETSGINVLSAPEGNRNAVGEHAFGMLLMLIQNLHLANDSVSQGRWEREVFRGNELLGKTVGIVGFGNTGSSFANKFAGWQTQVLAYDKYKTQFANDLRFVKECGLEELCKNADVISFHVPLTDETRYMVDKEFLMKCKTGVIIINTSRGSVVNTTDLVEALEVGIVRGACLDVLENEKPWTYSEEENQIYARLYAMNNVILSPHVAGWTIEAKRKISEVLLEKIQRAEEQ